MTSTSSQEFGEKITAVIVSVGSTHFEEVDVRLDSALEGRNEHR
jgi:hypothetical protein